MKNRYKHTRIGVVWNCTDCGSQGIKKTEPEARAEAGRHNCKPLPKRTPGASGVY